MDCNSGRFIGKAILLKYASRPFPRGSLESCVANRISSRELEIAYDAFIARPLYSRFARRRNITKRYTRESFPCASFRCDVRLKMEYVGSRRIFFFSRCEHMFRRISGPVSFIGLTLAVAFLDTGQLANFGNVFHSAVLSRCNRIMYTERLEIYAPGELNLSQPSPFRVLGISA